MLACLDVCYRDPFGFGAGVLFESWEAKSPLREWTLRVDGVAPYVPGQFYRREMPCLLRLLEQLPALPEIVLVDAYAWLGGEAHPGLGARLHESLGGRAAVVGVAKTRYRGAEPVETVKRGRSRSPLYVSAAGMPLAEAAAGVLRMYGRGRLPYMARRADVLARAAERGG
ncbi:MAG: endonuclease V [Planctomycetes bacterium]|nr:endonuclease V [Planctomycetota bacterium]